MDLDAMRRELDRLWGALDELAPSGDDADEAWEALGALDDLLYAGEYERTHGAKAERAALARWNAWAAAG